MISFLCLLKTIFCSKYYKFANELRKIYPDARVDDEGQSIFIGKCLILYDDQYFYAEPIGRSRYYEIEHTGMSPKIMARLVKNMIRNDEL